MRVALIADVHGNLTALEAVIADLTDAHVDEVVCLGDVAATGPQPRETVARLRALGCPVVMGNTDAAAVRPIRPVRLSPIDDNSRRFAEIDEWCAAQLTAEDLDYLRTFQPTLTVPLGADATLLCFHGSPRSNTEAIVATTPDAALARMFAGCDATVLAGGHTHAQFTRPYAGAILLNPGSVGLPYVTRGTETHNPPWAEYGIVTWRAGCMNVELRRVPLDARMVVRAALRSGMPHAEWWAADWQ